MKAAVLATGVAKAFRDGETNVQVLNGIDLVLPCGGMSFLVGPSGCGKTTLVSILSGILRASSGSVEVFGTRLAALKSLELARFRARTIGFVFQQFNLLAALTAVENAAVPLLIQGVKGAEARARSAALLERLGLGPQLHKLPAQLSGGSSSAWRLPAPWCTTRNWWCATSRPPRWMPRPVRSWYVCCAPSPPGRIAAWWWLRMTTASGGMQTWSP